MWVPFIPVGIIPVDLGYLQPTLLLWLLVPELSPLWLPEVFSPPSADFNSRSYFRSLGLSLALARALLSTAAATDSLPALNKHAPHCRFHFSLGFPWGHFQLSSPLLPPAGWHLTSQSLHSASMKSTNIYWGPTKFQVRHGSHWIVALVELRI